MQASALPDLGIEITIPMDMEFGVIAPPPAPAAPPAPVPEAPEPPVEEAAPPPVAEAAPAASDGVGEAPPKPRRRRRPRPAPAPEVVAAVESSSLLPSVLAEQGTDLTAFAPPGAQIALRIDFSRVRPSPIANDVRALLLAVPDWNALLEGSGIDALNDLDRLLIATPDLRREHIVLSGQIPGDRSKVEQAVLALAAARQLEAPVWREENGFSIAPWANIDQTERIVTLVGEHEFTITRPEDLPRVLAVAAARREREAQKRAQAAIDAANAPATTDEAQAAHQAPAEGAEPAAPTTPTAEGATEAPLVPEPPPLLQMRPNEIVALDIEGARNFARGNDAIIPLAVSVSVTSTPEEPNELHIHVEAPFDNAEATTRAMQVWSQYRDQFASHPLVALVGLGLPLRVAQLSTRDVALVVDTKIGLAPARFLLNYMRGWFADGRPLPRTLRAMPQGAQNLQTPASANATSTSIAATGSPQVPSPTEPQPAPAPSEPSPPAPAP